MTGLRGRIGVGKVHFANGKLIPETACFLTSMPDVQIIQFAKQQARRRGPKYLGHAACSFHVAFAAFDSKYLIR